LKFKINRDIIECVALSVYFRGFEVILVKKEQEGIVIQTKDKIAIVKIARHGDCENCGTCAGSNAAVLEMNNQIGAQKGERVVFETAEKGMLKAAFIVFCLPILAIFLGSQAGKVLSNALNSSSSLYQVLGGIIALLLSLGIIFLYEKSMKNNLSRLPKITKTIRMM
jgi:sigma-E factor negative regulatory protein RseC